MISTSKANRCPQRPNVRIGSNSEVELADADFRFTPKIRHPAVGLGCPFRADIVAKVFLGWRTKILRAADAFYAQRRSRISVVALKSDAAAERSTDQLSRDF